MAKKAKFEICQRDHQPAILLESIAEVEAAKQLCLQIYITDYGVMVKFDGEDATRRRDISLDHLSQTVGILEDETQNPSTTFLSFQDLDLI